MRINYKYKLIEGDTMRRLTTSCPDSPFVNVGSRYCQKCKHHILKTNDYVDCNFNENPTIKNDIQQENKIANIRMEKKEITEFNNEDLKPGNYDTYGLTKYNVYRDIKVYADGKEIRGVRKMVSRKIKWKRTSDHPLIIYTSTNTPTEFKIVHDLEGNGYEHYSNGHRSDKWMKHLEEIKQYYQSIYEIQFQGELQEVIAKYCDVER